MKTFCGLAFKAAKVNASLHVVDIIADVIDRQDRVPRHFLLDAEQPVRGNRVLGVLREMRLRSVFPRSTEDWATG